MLVAFFTLLNFLLAIKTSEGAHFLCSQLVLAITILTTICLYKNSDDQHLTNMIPSYPTVNDSASGLLTVGFNSTCNSRFPILLLNCGSYFCFTLVGCLPPILPLIGSYFCLALVGGSRVLHHVCNPNYGCSLLPECSGKLSKIHARPLSKNLALPFANPLIRRTFSLIRWEIRHASI